VAAVLDLDIEMIRSLNPEYRRDIVPGANKKHAIRLPMADAIRFIDLQDSIYSYHTDELLTKRAVAEVNDDQPTYRSKKSSRRGRSSRASRNSRRGGSSVTVRSGQTLGEIARRNGTTVAKLKRLNGLRGNNIRAGKKLRVR